MKDFFYLILSRIARFGLRLFYSLEVEGIENVPRRGGALLVANHASFFDPTSLGVELRRPVRFAARDTLRESWFMAFVIWACQVIQVRRDEGDSQAVRQIIRKLSEGELVAIFPEGTRTQNGELGPFEEGTILIARRAKVPMIPIGIAGTFEAFPRGAKFPRPSRIRVVYGTPFDASAGSREQALEELRRRIALLLEKARSKSAM